MTYPLYSFVLHVYYHSQFMNFIFLLFYASLDLQFLDVDTNPDTSFLFLVSFLLPYTLMCRVFPRTWVTWQWLHLSIIYYCALRPWFRTSIICWSCWFLDMVALSCFARTGCLEPVGWLHMFEMDMSHVANPSLSGCCKMPILYLGSMVPDRTCMCLVCITSLTYMIRFMNVQ